MNKPWRINRRMTLRGAGGIALALPFLQAMGLPRRAHAAPGVGLNGFPKRFITMFTSNGVVMNTWRPSGADGALQFGGSLAALQPHMKDVLVVLGPDNLAGATTGNPGHHSAAISALTGAAIIRGGKLTNPDRNANWGMGGMSIDQAIGEQIKGPAPFKTINVGAFFGNSSNILDNTLATGPDQKLESETNPQNQLMKLAGRWPAPGGGGGMTAGPSPEALALKARRTSVLDAVKADLASLQRRLGKDDQSTLSAHVQSLRELEQSLNAPVAAAGASCAQPMLSGSGGEATVRNFLRIIASAMACDLTRVATLQLGRAANQTQYTWLGVNRGHHDISHMPDSDARSMKDLTDIDNWNAGNLAFLIDQLKSIKEGPGTAFDNTVILWVHELSHGASHSLRNMPYVIAGSGGRYFRTGRFVEAKGTSSNDLFVSIQNAMGIDSKSFGTASYNKGPIPGLT